MARSHGVLKVEVWEAVSDFRGLTLDGQWAFAMLISQPQINNLGVLPYIPEKWSRLAADLDRDRLDSALDELDQTRYTITDEETGELLVRTFIRHDAVWKQPKLITNARRLLREVESDSIRSYLADRHPWLIDDSWETAKIAKHETRRRPPETPPDTPPDTPSERGSDTPIDQAVENSPAKGVTEGVSPPRARTQDGLPQPQGQPQPVVQEQPPAAANAREGIFNDAAAANLDERLEHIGLHRNQFDALTDPALITAWLDLAETEAKTNPAGLALTGIRTGQPPTPRAKANGTPTNYLTKAQALYQRTHNPETVADWLAGLPLSTTEREHILAEATAESAL